jgi:arylsulfatase
MRWKGTIQPGLACNQLASTIDIFPTIAALTGAPLSTNKIDGVDLSAIIKGDMSASPRKTFLYYYRKNALEAVRRDNWKLVLEHPSRSYLNQIPGKDGFPGKTPENVLMPLALYDLRRDPGEVYDVKAYNPQIVEELHLLAEEARKDLGDELQNKVGLNNRLPGKIH